MQLSPHLFRSYDIRGKAFTDLTPEVCRATGQAFGSELRDRYGMEHPRVCVGRDARTHSPLFEEAVIQGLIASGCVVLRIGQVPSPINYFTICSEKLDGGIQITASHNGPEDNGMKIQARAAIAFAGEDLQVLRRRIEGERFLTGEGREQDADAETAYRECMRGFPQNQSARTAAPRTVRRTSAGVQGKPRRGMLHGMRIVLDGGNGVAGPLYTAILRDQGAAVVEMYTTPDGTFPNHPADPCVWENLRDLRTRVIAEGAELGLAFDGDGDRVGFVDAQGRIRSSDEILLLLAEDHLTRHPGAPIVFTVSNSSVLPEQIERWGGQPIMCPVGHSHVEHTMLDHGSRLGGEQSGHFFCCEDYELFDDAMAATLRVLSIFVAKRGTWNVERGTLFAFSDLFTSYPKVYQMPEWRPHCPDDRKTEVIHRTTAHFVQSYPCITMDGVRIDFGDGAWAGVRQSNTSPRISLCCEARSPAKLKAIVKIVKGHLQSYPEVEGAKATVNVKPHGPVAVARQRHGGTPHRGEPRRTTGAWVKRIVRRRPKKMLAKAKR